jgi:hypothetical protein
MDSFQFIPTNQKNIDQFVQKKSYSVDQKIIIWLTLLFILYLIVVGVFYWVVILNEKSKLQNAIEVISSENLAYYPKGDMEQLLFNLNDLADKSYNPMPVIKSIESAYNPNSRIRGFVYSKSDKSISLSIAAPTIADMTTQVQKFKTIKEIANVDFDSTGSGADKTDFGFSVKIRLN